MIVEQTFSKLKFTYLGIKNAVGPYNLIRTGENYDPALGTCLYVSIRDLHGNLWKYIPLNRTLICDIIIGPTITVFTFVSIQ